MLTLLNDTINRLYPFYSSACLAGAALVSIFFGLSDRKGIKVFLIFLSVCSIFASLFFNIFSFLKSGSFSDFLFVFDKLQVVEISIILFSAINILLLFSIYNFRKQSFSKILIIFQVAVFLITIFILSNNLIMIFCSLALAVAGIFQLVTLLAGQSDIRTESEYLVKNQIIRFFMVASFSLIVLFTGFSLIFGVLDFKTFVQIVQSDKLENPLLRTGLFIIFTGIFTYLFIFPLQSAYIKLIKRTEGISALIIWFFYYPAGIFLFLKLFDIFATFTGKNIFLNAALYFIALVCIAGGNIGAVKTTSLRRIMSFLFLATLGFSILSLAFFSTRLIESAAVLRLIIANTVFLIFIYFPVYSIFLEIERQKGSDSIENIRGFARNNKYSGIILILILLSFAGLAGTSGYIVKIIFIQPFIDILKAQTAGWTGSSFIILNYTGSIAAIAGWIFFAANIIRMLIYMVRSPGKAGKILVPKFYHIYILFFCLILIYTGIAGLMELTGSTSILTGIPVFSFNF
ncbi:MAG: hypothetical protein FJW66_02015 [Actinobacteria bacterium]|nr:hypothetical protein [Actinomycetota bacterium]